MIPLSIFNENQRTASVLHFQAQVWYNNAVPVPVVATICMRGIVISTSSSKMSSVRSAVPVPVMHVGYTL
jgi:hypothetical protein